MNLVLKLLNPDILPANLRTRQVEFDGDGGTIGRNDSCDWVLDDPERFVSSRHLNIVFKGQRFFAEDISTNGTFLNDELIGNGERQPLRTGDTLRVGRYMMSVEARDAQNKVIGDPGSSTRRAKKGKVESDLLSDDGAVESVDPFIGDTDHDPLGTEDARSSLLDAAPLGGVQDAAATVMPSAADAIPDDWMEGGLAASEPAGSEPGLVPELEPEPEPAIDLMPDIEPEVAHPEGIGSEYAEPGIVRLEPMEPAPAPPAPDPVPASPIAAPRMPAPAAAAPLTTAADTFEEAFLEQIRLAPDYATPQNGALLGAVARELLTGWLDLLLNRSQIRQELRLDATLIGARENNPLKFSLNYQDAIGRMLQGESMGFMPPVESARQVADDLSAHQLAMMAGIDAGVKALVASLEPKAAMKGKSALTGAQAIAKLAEHHQRVAQDTTERHDGVFWHAFKEAYQSTITRVQDQRRYG